MDVVPLLAHKEEEPFRNSKASWEGRENHTYQEVGLLGMGQSGIRGNRIQDSVYQDWSMPNSTIKCKFNCTKYVSFNSWFDYKRHMLISL